MLLTVPIFFYEKGIIQTLTGYIRNLEDNLGVLYIFNNQMLLEYNIDIRVRAVCEPYIELSGAKL